ncbi:YnbE family lipoprotein [Flavisphingomonas formosensis]|uniref:YnbE family lipoprotein n=1 Tax=Flavisphingomonas formosensis TaxID=861534 RepID=UPI0038CD3CE0
MNKLILTDGVANATSPGMGARKGAAIGLMAAAGMALSGCVSLKAPEKPIEINLNINIKQEVVYRLDGEAKSLIQQQSGIF